MRGDFFFQKYTKEFLRNPQIILESGTKPRV